MKIVFASNYLNHHERFLCDALYENPRIDFVFIQTKPIEQGRINMGWQDMSDVPYCICSYESPDDYVRAMDSCNNADALILGAAPNEFIAERVKKDKLTFFYAERLFRNGVWHMLNPLTFITVLKRFIIPGHKSNFYLLAASGFTAIDTQKITAFKGRRFKWGHFIEVAYPEGRKTKVDDGKIHLLWAGRFLKLKHPDYPIRIAKTLKERDVDFVLDIIGSGEQETAMKSLIKDYNIEDNVIIHGIMKPTEVRTFMEHADIYLFTSDFNEGWGAVLGESMASGCAVVTSHGIGATPFLAKHNENGLIYETGNYGSFERNVLKLIESKELRKRLSKNAIDTMLNLWNPKNGAQRFYELCKAIIETGKPIYYPDGPISKAEIINNNWFKDDTK
ncbi:glycosyltransferase [Bacteroides sp. f07]|uniref:glycosyltransferase n=1 Tax=Bacteroides sp. f07 TaxID=3132704 RepID=UPI0036F3C7CB